MRRNHCEKRETLIIAAIFYIITLDSTRFNFSWLKGDIHIDYVPVFYKMALCKQTSVGRLTSYLHVSHDEFFGVFFLQLNKLV